MGTFSALQSQSTAVYASTTSLEFIALGAGHFNLVLNQLPTFDLLAEENGVPRYRSTPGWNGRISPTAPFQSQVSLGPNPFYTDAFQWIEAGREGLYYLHIVGNSPGDVFNSNVFQGESYRVYVDTTPPDTGPVSASFEGVLPIEENTPAGLATPYFSWSSADLTGEPTSRSPILGYTFSLSTDVVVEPGVSAGGSDYLPRAAGPIQYYPSDLRTLGVPLTGLTTFYFQVRGLDQAGNWGAPRMFTYVFTPDSTRPRYTGAQLAGARLSGDESFAGVDPSAAIYLQFTKEMALPRDGALTLTLEGDADGMAVGSTVPCTVVIDTTTLVATVTPDAPLESGARYHLKNTDLLTDRSSLRLLSDNQIRITFFTRLNPARRTVVRTPDGTAAVVIPAGAWRGGAIGVPAADDPVLRPLGLAPALGDLIGRADEALGRSPTGAHTVLSRKEFRVISSPDGAALLDAFAAPVEMSFRFTDDGNGHVLSVPVPGAPAPGPYSVKSLAIFRLDERTGAWVRLPGSVVDEVTREVRVAVTRLGGVYALVASPDTELAEAHVYPSPYRPSTQAGGITFAKLSTNATIRIYTLDGRLVRTLTKSDGATDLLNWDPVTNEGGEPLASDVYLYVIENGLQKKVGKLAVIR
jgi:hypothetical protein